MALCRGRSVVFPIAVNNHELVVLVSQCDILWLYQHKEWVFEKKEIGEDWRLYLTWSAELYLLLRGDTVCPEASYETFMFFARKV